MLDADEVRLSFWTLFTLLFVGGCVVELLMEVVR